MTQRFSKSVFVASVFAATVTVAFAQQNVGRLDKHAMYAQMRSLAREIDTLSALGADASKIDELRAQYASLSEMMGGDDPANINRQANNSVAPTAANGAQFLVTPACAGSATTTTNFPGATGAIPDFGNVPGTLSVTALVSSAGTYLWDINVNTTITHTENADLDITLTSPAGTVCTITTDNGAANDNVFNGTVWDDSINDTTMDHVYTNLVAATPLNAEGRLGNFRGENPNGTWTLTVRDDTATDIGTLSAFSLDITTAAPPSTTTNTFSTLPALAIGPGPSLHSSAQIVGGVGTVLTEVELYMELTHTFSGDLDMTLLPPVGPAIKLSTDNGAGNDNNFNGTTFDQDSVNVATDFAYVNLVVVPNLQPEGSFDNWIGIDPNGSWTLNVDDDAGGDSGVLARWDITVTTELLPLSLTGPTNYVGGTGAIPDAGPPAPTQFACVVSAVGTSLWDVDANVNITHTFNADLDISLVSAAGTSLPISTDNGGSFNDVFAGTLFDDDANDPTTDHVYVDLTVATPLSPEGRFSAFRGENPNGTWNLVCFDDLGADVGTVNSFSLDITTIAPVPTENSDAFSDSPALAITDLSTVSDTQAVSGIGTSMTEVVLYTEITHTQNDELDITLTSPLGTVVAVTTDNGSTNDNVFNGTTWDPDSNLAITDIVTVNNVVVVTAGPEGSFDNFGGEDPNGNWTLTITDDTSTDTGTLVRWDLTIKTCAATATVLDCQILPTVTQTCDSVASATGTPSATSGSGFTTTFASLNAQVNGVVFYGINGPNSAPWSTQSLLCIKSPTVRLGGVPGASGSTGGVIGNCDGQYSFDFNAVALAAGLTQNTTVIVQGWQRDPASTKTTNLTDALSFILGP